MSYQECRIRNWVFGFAVIVAAVGMSGCTSSPGVRGAPSALTSATFDIEFATTGSGDEAVSISPEHGDAWLVSKKDGSSSIFWTSKQKFGIKFVQIDDQGKEQKNKFGSGQKAGWNDSDCDGAGTCTLTLRLDAGSDKPHKKKEIRGAKYIVASPSGCPDLKPIPANCKWVDPVIIVRY